MEANFQNHKVKNFNGVSDAILSLNRVKSFNINLPNHALDGLRINLKRTNDNFSFSISYLLLPGEQKNEELRFQKNQKITLSNTKKTLFVDSNSFLPVKIAYRSKTKYVTGHIDSLSSTDKDYNFENKFHRLVIPTTQKFSDDFFKLFIHTSFIYGKIKSSNMIECNINGNLFETLLLIENNTYYIVFDSLQTLSFEEFNKYCFSVFLSLAFVNGKFIQDNGYFFTYPDKEMNNYENYRFQVLINSILTNNPIIPDLYESSCIINSNNPTGNNSHGSINHKSEYICPTVLNKLCDIVHNVEKVQRSVYNFILANLENAHKSVPSYYVILESLSSYIDTIYPALKSVPIKDSTLSKSFLLELKTIANNWHDNLSDKELADLTILIKRIDTLNRPANTDKLSSSLSSLSLNIFPDQRNIIKERDIFLHGSVMKSSDYQELNRKMYHLKSRLQTLIAALILKICSFNGCIINYSKYYEPYTLLTNGEIEYILI